MPLRAVAYDKLTPLLLFCGCTRLPMLSRHTVAPSCEHHTVTPYCYTLLQLLATPLVLRVFDKNGLFSSNDSLGQVSCSRP